MGLSEKERDSFKLVINDLLITVKNCTLYDPSHPIFQLSIQKLKNSLDEWFETQSSFQIGISPTQLFVTSASIDIQQGFSSEIANLLHIKGILSLEIDREIPSDELEAFITLLRLDRRTYEEEEQISSQLKQFQHIRIREIDYQHLLSSQTSQYSTEEEKIWGALLKPTHFDQEDLPPDKISFLLQFLKSTEKGASFLNKVYHQALRSGSDERIVKAFQYVISQISEYFQNQTNPQAEKQYKIDLMQILSQLHPDFISKLFDETVLGGKKFDMSASIMQNMSDSDLAGFIESLIANEGSVNEYLLRIFNKLVPDSNRADQIAPLIADTLANKSLVTPHSLTQIQLSIKELFKQKKSDHFLNAMYKITVEAMSQSDSDMLTFSVNLAPLVNKFIKTVDVKRCREERILILLRILEQETDESQFKKFSERLLRVYEESIEAADVEAIKKLLAFYSHRIYRERDTESALLDHKKNVYLQLVQCKYIEQIASFIAGASDVDLDQIANIILVLRPFSGPVLINYYLSHPGERKKCFRVFSGMESYIGNLILKEFDKREPRIIRELLFVLKNLSPDKLNVAAQKLLKQSDSFLLWEALDNIIPQTQEEISYILQLFLKDKNPEIQRKAMIALLRGNENSSIQKLFSTVRRKKSRRRFMSDLITLSGSLAVKNAYPHLQDIAAKRPFIYNDKIEAVRLSAVSSMAQIDRAETLRFVSERLSGKDQSVKEKCQEILNRQTEAKVDG